MIAGWVFPTVSPPTMKNRTIFLSAGNEIQTSHHSRHSSGTNLTGLNKGQFFVVNNSHSFGAQNCLNAETHSINYERKIHCFFITQTNCLMLFTKIITVHCKNHAKHCLLEMMKHKVPIPL